MKVNYLGIVGFQGIRSLEIDKPNPVIVLSGPNASGKSSVRDAIQFALDGSSNRCKLKKEYASQLVNINTIKKDALVTLVLDDREYQRKVATGAITADEEPRYPEIFPWLIGTRSFNATEATELQRIIMRASGVKVTRELIEDRLIKAGARAENVKHLMPFLRSGFPAALNEAKSCVSGKRGEWKGITGEIYGTDKAERWVKDSVNISKMIDLANIEIATAKGTHQETTKKRDALMPASRAQASSSPSGGYTDIGDCPACGASLRKVYPGNALYVRGMEPAIDIPLPAGAKAVAGDTYESLDRALGSLNQRIGVLTAQRDQLKADMGAVQSVTDSARVVHKELLEWDLLAKLLSPDGLPKSLIQEALVPVNDRIAKTCDATGWPIISITSDLTIWYGAFAYDLCSESEKWRADAAIVEALAFLSGVKMFAIDRMDILAPKDRGSFIKWISNVRADHDTIIIMATLKEEPKVPYGFTSVWLGER